MVNLGRVTTAGLQTSSQRLIAATIAEPRNSFLPLLGRFFFSFIVLAMGILETRSLASPEELVDGRPGHY
jgi:hypothetical protein